MTNFDRVIKNKFFKAVIAVSSALVLTIGGIVASAPSTVSAEETEVMQEYRLIAEKAARLLRIEGMVKPGYVSFDGDQYNIYWNPASDESGVIDGETYLDKDGHVICSYLFDYGREGEALGTKEEMLIYAEELIKSVVPEAVGHLRYNDVTDDMDEYYYYSFIREENGLPVPQNTIDMLISRTDGTCTSLDIYWDYETEFPKPGKLISSKKAIGIAKNIAMPSLRYCKQINEIIDEKTGKTTMDKKVYLAYRPLCTWVRIDASSGEVLQSSYTSDPDNLHLSYYYDDGIPKSYFVKNKEIEKIREKYGLISSDSALQTLMSNKYLLINSSEEEPTISLCQKMGDNGYIWIINRNTYDDPDHFSAYVDAKTGDLIYFSCNVPREGSAGDLRYKKKECKKTALGFTKTLNKDRYSQMKRVKIGSGKTFLDLDTGKYKTGKYFFTFTRMHEGIPFNENGAEVGVDRITGKIAYFYSEWDEGVTFPEPTGVISASKAFKKMYELSEGDPGYYIDHVEHDGKEVGTVSVSYDLFAENGNIDAFTGKILDYNGNPRGNIA